MTSKADHDRTRTDGAEVPAASTLLALSFRFDRPLSLFWASKTNSKSLAIEPTDSEPAKKGGEERERRERREILSWHKRRKTGESERCQQRKGLGKRTTFAVG